MKTKVMNTNVIGVIPPQDIKPVVTSLNEQSTLVPQVCTIHRSFAAPSLSDMTVREQKKLARAVVDALMLSQCLGIFLSDIQSSLEEKGMMKHEIKRDYNRLNMLVGNVMNQSNDLFKYMTEKGQDKDLRREYTECCDILWQAIYESTSLEGLERAVSLFISTLKLIQEKYDFVARSYVIFHHWNIGFCDTLRKAQTYLKNIKVKDYDLQAIIRQHVTNLYSKEYVTISM